MNGQVIAGTVVVVGLALALAMPLVYGIYDVVKFAHGLPVPAPTASSWMSRFLMRHPIVAFTAGVSIGILAGHFGWFQTFCVP